MKILVFVKHIILPLTYYPTVNENGNAISFVFSQSPSNTHFFHFLHCFDVRLQKFFAHGNFCFQVLTGCRTGFPQISFWSMYFHYPATPIRPACLTFQNVGFVQQIPAWIVEELTQILFENERSSHVNNPS